MAALRDKMAERVRPHLQPGEQLRQVFMAQTGPSPYWVFLTYLTMLWNKYLIVVVTDRSIVTFRASAFKPSFVKQPPDVHRLDRRRALGPLKGLWGKVDIDGQRYWVHKRFHSDVAAADAELVHFGGAVVPQAAMAPSAASPYAAQAVGASAVGVGSAGIPAFPAAATATPTAAMAPAGWYPDPHRVAAQRYWDGHTWTEHTA